MRFFFLIPAITALGVAGCQMPPQTAATPPAREVAATTVQDNMTKVTSPTSDTQPLQSVLEPAETEAETETTAPQPDADGSTGNTEMAMLGDADAPVPETAMASDTLEETVPLGEPDAPEKTDAGLPVIDPDDGDATAPEPVGDTAAVEEPADIATSSQPATTPAPSTPTETAMPPVPQDASNSDHDTADMESEPATDTEEDMLGTELALAAPPPPPPSPPPPPTPPPPPPELDPQDLIGLDASSLESRLGEADFRRLEGVVETRQYRFTACVVDYFLYPEDSVTAVRNWAWRSPVIGRSLDATACRQALAERDDAR